MRNLLYVVIFTSILSGCSVANSLRMIYANKDITPALPASVNGEYKATLKAFYIGEKPYIKVKANGQQELLFLIDTGASFTMLFDTENTAKLKFEEGFPLEVRGWGDGEDSPAFQTQLSSIAIAEATFSDVKVGYIPISTSQYYLTPDEAIFDGVLGHDLIRHFSWMFDKEGEKITISTGTFAPEASDVVVPINPFFSKITMPVTVNIDGQSFEQEVYVDTGSRHYYKFNTAFVANREITLPEQTVKASDFGLSGEAKHTRLRLPSLNIGELELSGVKANLIYAEDEDDFSIIGSALMNQFVTIIDYQNNTLTFRPYPNRSFVTQFNLAGLDIRKLKNGLLIVRHVFPELVADKNGFETGMIITSINGQKADNLTEEDWLEMSATPDTFTFCFERQQSCKTITTKHIPGYSIELPQG